MEFYHRVITGFLGDLQRFLFDFIKKSRKDAKTQRRKDAKAQRKIKLCAFASLRD
jgi:hypothetical protein